MVPGSSTLGWSSTADVGAEQHAQHVADRSFAAHRLPKRQIGLDLVAVASAVLLLHHVAAFGEVGHDAVGRALGDVQGRGDVTQADAGVVGYAHEDPGMVGEEAPVGHSRSSYQADFWRLVAS